MKAKLVVELDAAPSADDPQLVEKDGKFVWPVGSIIEDPKAYRLVQMGVAEPADDECKARANMSYDQMKAAQAQQDLVGKGIAPEDYERYQAGEMVGYDADGNDIPGPNFKGEE